MILRYQYNQTNASVKSFFAEMPYFVSFLNSDAQNVLLPDRFEKQPSTLPPLHSREPCAIIGFVDQTKGGWEGCQVPPECRCLAVSAVRPAAYRPMEIRQVIGNIPGPN